MQQTGETGGGGDVKWEYTTGKNCILVTAYTWRGSFPKEKVMTRNRQTDNRQALYIFH